MKGVKPMRMMEISDSIIESLFDSILTNAPKTSTYFAEGETDLWWYSFKYIRNYTKEILHYIRYELDTQGDLDRTGQVIGQENDEKWSRLLSIYYAEYNALHDYNITETKDSTIERDVDESIKSKSEHESTTNVTNGIYGFNSSQSVPSSDSETSVDESTTALTNDNNRTLADDVTEDTTTTRSGNTRPISELYEKEWNARKTTIIEYIMRDISEYITINVY